MDTPADASPRWLHLLAATAAAAGLFAFVASPRTALYWYIFPLFGLGGCYLVQFRSELQRRWVVTFAATAVLSAVALALDWPFSGHVLWNVLFIGHAWRNGRRRTAWMALLVGSLVYLFALKVASQTGRDLVGAFISVAVAAVVLLVLGRLDRAAAPGDRPERPADRRGLRTAVVADFRSASWARRLALLAVCGWLAYEWGPGNEVMTPWILVRVFASTNGWVAVVATTATGFAFTTAQQFASGVTALAGFSMFDRTAAAAWRMLRQRRKSAVPEWERSGWATRFALVFALGTTAVALVQIVASGRTGVRRHLRVIAASAALNGTIVGTFSAVSATIAVLAGRVSSLEKPTGRVIADLSNPLVWVGVGTAVLVVSMVRGGTSSADIDADIADIADDADV